MPEWSSVVMFVVEVKQRVEWVTELMAGLSRLTAGQLLPPPEEMVWSKD